MKSRRLRSLARHAPGDEPARGSALVKTRRLSCWQCKGYDRDARRCRSGKANPRKKHESLTLAEMLGPRALCLHNPFREPLLLRMYQPHRRFSWADEPPPPAVPLEIEIVE